MACADPADLYAGGVTANLPSGLPATHTYPDVIRALNTLAACVIPLRERESGLDAVTLPWPRAGQRVRIDDLTLKRCWRALPALPKDAKGGDVTIAAGGWPTR